MIFFHVAKLKWIQIEADFNIKIEYDYFFQVFCLLWIQIRRRFL